MKRTLLLFSLCLALTGCKCSSAKYNDCMDKGEHRVGNGVLVGCVHELRGVVVFEELGKEPFSPWLGMPVYDQDKATIYPGAMLSCVTPDGRQTSAGNWTSATSMGMSHLLPREVLMERARKNPQPPMMRYHGKNDRMKDFNEPPPTPIEKAKALPPVPGPVKGIRIVGWNEVKNTQKEGRTVTRYIRKPVDKSSHEGLKLWKHSELTFWVIEEKDVPKALWALSDREDFAQCVRHLVERDKNLTLDVGTVGVQLEIKGGKVVAAQSIRQYIGAEKTAYDLRQYQCLEDSLMGLEVGTSLGDGWIQVFFVWWR
jgi:hypothetical protein